MVGAVSYMGKEKSKGRALVRQAGDADDTIMLLHDAMHDGETQPGTLPHGFGGEERFKDARLILLGYPDTRVRYLKLNAGRRG